MRYFFQTLDLQALNREMIPHNLLHAFKVETQIMGCRVSKLKSCCYNKLPEIGYLRNMEISFS